MEETGVLIAFSLTLLAGLSTGIGSALAFFTRRTNIVFLSVALGFSAGVMIYISFVEILANARAVLTAALGNLGYPVTVISFFSGLFFIALVDRLIPVPGNPHEIRRVEEMSRPEKDERLARMGVFTAVTIAIHNFPEGLVTFMAALNEVSLGVPVAVAVAIHNIPEGIAVSIPIYFATGSRKKAFGLSFLSGLSEPLGAGLGYLLLRPFFSDVVFGAVFAAVAGIMVFISLDELLPAAREYGEHHLSIYGLVAGMLVMAVSLLVLA